VLETKNKGICAKRNATVIAQFNDCELCGWLCGYALQSLAVIGFVVCWWLCALCANIHVIPVDICAFGLRTNL
jgi:hypothetical protein